MVKFQPNIKISKKWSDPARSDQKPGAVQVIVGLPGRTADKAEACIMAAPHTGQWQHITATGRVELMTGGYGAGSALARRAFLAR